MLVISLLSQKGGTGKTTIVLGLAVAAVQAGGTVAVVDLDPQANAASWRDRRAGKGPAVVAAPASRLKATIDGARDSGADLCIVDTPGKSDSIAIEAARASDLVLIPARSSVLDLETLPAMLDLLRLAGSPSAFVVLDGMHPAATTGAKDTKTMVAKASGIPVCPVHLCQQAAYAEEPANGLSAQELDTSSRAADEMRRLYVGTWEHVHKLHGKAKHG
jgi:chromosome partitioning protein